MASGPEQHCRFLRPEIVVAFVEVAGKCVKLDKDLTLD